MTKKRFVYNIFDITGDFEKNELKLYEIDNNPSDDLDESNLFYMYSTSESNIKSIVDKLNSLVNENEELKQRNTNQYNQLTELWQIIEEENWEKLIAMKKQLKEDEERLQQEWKCYE